mgnify:CR=1 FL=1
MDERDRLRLVTHYNPKSPVAEAYRILRTNLNFAGLDRPFKTLLITSAGPSDGKSTTLGNLGIAMAQAGGMGILHRNLTVEEQADQVREVKRYESGMVVNPIVIGPDATLADALALMKSYRISGIPVVENGGAGGSRLGRLVGILTNRDVRFASNPNQRVYELMTRENLVTVPEGVLQDEAKRILHKHRIEKLLVVDGDYRCIGLITVKDIEKAQLHPNAAKDAQGRLRVAAATTVGDQGFERSEMLIDAGVDLIVVDTAHGHSAKVLEAVSRVKKIAVKKAWACRMIEASPAGMPMVMA